MLSLLLAQAEAPAQSPLAGPGNMLFLVAIFFGIFYFMIIRPQQKQQKTHKSFLESLKKGDEVITNGGLIGRIAGVQGDVLTLEIANNVRVRVLKDQVNRPFVVKEPPPAPAAEDAAKK
ncbi:MAG TPA: preprotein translocase subunit YajC [Myxococcales bacterium]|nr:preprotein translocase subunit YajC [Myxococcales bacterium]